MKKYSEAFIGFDTAKKKMLWRSPKTGATVRFDTSERSIARQRPSRR
jgi:phage-related protein